jgi:hypothetical protein
MRRQLRELQIAFVQRNGKLHVLANPGRTARGGGKTL